jgi:selT/selW/selH-like putative selenoprotein
MFAMLLVMIGDNLWTYIPGFHRGPPEFYHKMKENPALTFIIVFLIIPSYVQSFANTGAFEIHVDNKLVYSKLETGRMPTVPEVIKALEAAGMKRGS